METDIILNSNLTSKATREGILNYREKGNQNPNLERKRPVNFR